MILRPVLYNQFIQRLWANLASKALFTWLCKMLTLQKDEHGVYANCAIFSTLLQIRNYFKHVSFLLFLCLNPSLVDFFI